jgi:Tetracyclin repressor-like, C-terminal domain
MKARTLKRLPGHRNRAASEAAGQASAAGQATAASQAAPTAGKTATNNTATNNAARVVSTVARFRRVGSREELISQALWRLTERMLEIAVERWEAERPEGELHTPGTIRHINAMVAGSTGLRRLLDDEPALTLRVLTDPRGRVQSGIVAFNEVLLRRDMEEFGLVTIIEPSALAYALVRLGESFLYADVIAARKPDVETANRLQQAIIEGILP